MGAICYFLLSAILNIHRMVLAETETTSCKSGMLQFEGECYEKCPTGTVLGENNICLRGESGSNRLPYAGSKLKNPVHCPSGFCDSFRPLCYNLQCYQECPTNTFLFGKNCLHKCPPEKHLNLYRTCVDACPSEKPFIEENNCVSNCSSTHFILHNVCVTECPKGYFVLHDQCVLKCPPEFRYELSLTNTNQCVEQCPTFTNIVGNVCKLECPVDNPVLYNRLCVSSCTEETPFYIIQTTIYNSFITCLSSCPSEKIIEGKSCVESCSKDTVLFNNSCVDQCPSSLPLNVYSYDINSLVPVPNSQRMLNSKAYIVCNDTCPADYFRVNNSCYMSCPSSTYIFNGRCVTVCPETHPMIDGNRCIASCVYNVYGHLCLTMCPNDTVAFNKTCVSQCPSTNSFFSPGNRECKQSCPNLHTEQVCVDRCPHGFVVYNKSCVSRCPSTNRFIQNVTKELSPAYHLKKYIWKTIDFECVMSCPSFLVKYANNCLINCPSHAAYLLDQECLSECPELHPFSYSQILNEPNNPKRTRLQCLDKCPVTTVEEGKTCKDKCMNTNSTYILNRKCVSHCPETHKYVDFMSKTCLDTCPKFTMGNICVNNCPSNMTAFISECVINCPSFLPYKFYEIENTEASKCSAKCPAKYVIDGKRCIKYCPSTRKYLKGRECASICDDVLPFVHIVLEKKYEWPYTGRDIYRCVADCPQGMVNEQSVCKESCSEQFKYRLLKKCYSICPKSHPLHFTYTNKGNSYHTCVKRCPEQSYYINTTNECGLYCPKKYFAFNENCIKQCPDSHPLNYTKEISGELAFFCEKSCPMHTRKTENKCFDHCPVLTYTFRDKCLKQCPNSHRYMYQPDANNKFNSVFCTDKCPKFTEGQKCVSSCSFKFPFLFRNECLSECPKESPYATTDGIRYCNTSCPADTALYTDYMCVAICPYNVSYIFQRKCVKNCPQSHKYIEIKEIGKICKYRCDNDQVINTKRKLQLCVTKCPNFKLNINGECTQKSKCPQSIPYIENRKQGKTCTSNCSSGYYLEDDICQEVCSFGYVIHDGRCVAKCPQSHPYELSENALDYANNIYCHSTCPDGYHIDGQFCVSTDKCHKSGKFIEGNYCVSNCQADHFQIESEKVCSAECPKNMFGYQTETAKTCVTDKKCYTYGRYLENNSCVSHCQQGYFLTLYNDYGDEYDNNMKVCSSVCPKDYFIQGSNCSKCDEENQYVFQQGCLMSCPKWTLLYTDYAYPGNKNHCVSITSSFFGLIISWLVTIGIMVLTWQIMIRNFFDTCNKYGSDKAKIIIKETEDDEDTDELDTDTDESIKFDTDSVIDHPVDNDNEDTCLLQIAESDQGQIHDHTRNAHCDSDIPQITNTPYIPQKETNVTGAIVHRTTTIEDGLDAFETETTPKLLLHGTEDIFCNSRASFESGVNNMMAGHDNRNDLTDMKEFFKNDNDISGNLRIQFYENLETVNNDQEVVSPIHPSIATMNTPIDGSKQRRSNMNNLKRDSISMSFLNRDDNLDSETFVKTIDNEC